MPVNDKHSHIYQKTKSNKSYRCIKPGCPHMLQKDLMEHREAECPYCSASFIITKEHLRRKLVHCLECTNQGKPVAKEGIEPEDIELFINSVKEREIGF